MLKVLKCLFRKIVFRIFKDCFEIYKIPIDKTFSRTLIIIDKYSLINSSKKEVATLTLKAISVFYPITYT